MMRKFKYLIAITLIGVSTNSFCCDCKELGTLDSLRKIGFDVSDKVFLGELVSVDTTDLSYTFRVIEQFKGDFKSTTIKGKYYNICSLFPRVFAKWIVYANDSGEEFIDVSHCLASRSEMDPMCANCYIPPPPSNFTEKDIEDNQKRMEILKAKAKEDWYLEIEWLRKKNKE